jgi:sec-independent protein translocase protein TatC
MTKGKSGEMPFLDHLEELRHRLLWSLGALLVCMIGSFAIVMNPDFEVIGRLAAPILPYLPDGKLVFTSVVDPFSISLKVAFGVGLVAASPVIGYHVWRFLSPALHAHEKRLMVPVLIGATILFASGVFIGWRYVLPLMIEVLLQMQSGSLQQMITAASFFSFMIAICLAFGAVAELPILILALTALGLVSPSGLARYRRHAMVGSVLVAAIVTPGDIFLVTALLAGPLYALYEVSIVVSWFVHRAKLRRARAEASASIGGAAA